MLACTVVPLYDSISWVLTEGLKMECMARCVNRHAPDLMPPFYHTLSVGP